MEIFMYSYDGWSLGEILIFTVLIYLQMHILRNFGILEKII